MRIKRVDERPDGGDRALINPGSRARMRFRQIPPLLAQKTRLVRWKPIPAGAAVGFVVLVQFRSAATTDSGLSIVPIRVAAVALCLGAVFVLDDAAAETVAPVANPLRYRRSLRVALGVALVAAAWTGLLLTSMLLALGDTTEALPTWGLTLELAGMLTVGLAAAALATRWVPEGLGGLAAGPTLVVLVTASLFLPHRWTLFPGSVADPEWSAAHGRWVVIVLLAVLVLLHSSRDPAAPGMVRRDRPSRVSRMSRKPVRGDRLRR